ncbi:Beta-ketoacyl-acyl-carrier-protein synthase I [Piscirickettsia salmonis]|uniref:NAD(P)H-quinone oxidoreductase n=1 Tax=Piscirickettsia salmonis TaxID=1238 RepID=UPI0012B9CD4E|nr:NAD(P)H-quinone oxidoreductase [Piscirickettsia salmonis]QGP50386.1 Beta-ketoacyl-acyl-carrier-protein synthase I [Piscirickettsia salmonis]
MNYIDSCKPGGPEVLQLQQTDVPATAVSEVLIKVKATAVNGADIIQRKGFYPVPADASPILGLEVSGVIEAVGDNVNSWQVGDRVCALTNGGGYAEYVNVPAEQCLPIPDNVSLLDAASLPETYFTVWSNMIDLAKLKKGERFLVHGGSGGIGSTAIQLAKALGAKVYTTAGSDEKCQVCKALGADYAINYRTEDFVEIVLGSSEQQGVDVILDMMGGEYLNRSITCAALNGRIAMIAFRGGARAEIDCKQLLYKRLTLTGNALRPQPLPIKAAIAQNIKNIVWPLFSANKLKPVIASVFPLAQANQAHQLMESSQHIGKIVLEVS